MLQIQDLNLTKSCLETMNVVSSQVPHVPELMILPHVLQLLKYTKVSYLRCFVTSDGFLTKLLQVKV